MAENLMLNMPHYFCLDIFQCIQHWRKTMSTTNKARDRDADGKLRRKYRCFYGVPFPQGTPKWWRKLAHDPPAAAREQAYLPFDPARRRPGWHHAAAGKPQAT